MSCYFRRKIMKHYNFKKIREKGDCVKFAVEVLGATVAEGR